MVFVWTILLINIMVHQICGGLSQEQIQNVLTEDLFLKPGKEYRIPTDISETGEEFITGGGQVGNVSGGY